MERLGVYEVLINGIPHTLQLSEEDAKAHGLLGERKVEGTPPGSEETKAAAEAEAVTPANKGRKPSNK